MSFLKSQRRTLSVPVKPPIRLVVFQKKIDLTTIGMKFFDLGTDMFRVNDSLVDPEHHKLEAAIQLNRIPQHLQTSLRVLNELLDWEANRRESEK